jgi:predicted deacylase
MNRQIVSAEKLDLDSPGRRDYHVRFEHPTYWGDYLVPVTVFVGREARDGRGVLAIGATHGNEYEGPVAIKHLMSEINPELVRGRMILMPTLNVPAFNAGVRDTPDDGVNLNRAFPGDARGSITQRLAHFVSAQLFPRVHVVLDIHSGGQVARFVPISSFHHVENESQRRAMETAARGFGARFTMIYQNKTPGLLTSMAERLGKITIGSEFGWGAAVLREGVSMARQGILAAAIEHGQYAGEQPKNQHCPREKQVLVDNSEPACYVPAPFDGHFEPLVDCGEYVKKAQRIGWQHDFNRLDAPAVEILAPHDGVVLCQAWTAKVFRGQVVSVVSIPVPWLER